VTDPHEEARQPPARSAAQRRARRGGDITQVAAQLTARARGGQTRPLCCPGAACYEGRMKRLLKWGIRLVLVLIVLVVLAVALRNTLARPLVEKEIRRATGLTAILGRVSFGLTAPTLRVENLRLLNSAEFGGEVFADVPDLQVEYDFVALRDWKVRLRSVRLNVSQLNAVRNKDGRNNLRAFQEDTLQRLAAPGSRTADFQFEGVDALTVTLARFRLTDQLVPAKNMDDSEWIGLKNVTVKNVKTLADLEPLFAPLTQQRHLKALWEHVSRDVLKPAPPAVPKPEPDQP
jgi:hypothetical protein